MSKTIETWSEWLKSSRFSYMNEVQKEQTLRWLAQVRDKVLDRANLKPEDTLIDIGTGTGLLSFGAYELLKGAGKVIASDLFEDCLVECKKIVESCNITDGFEFLQSSATDIKLPDNSVDVVVMRSVLVHILDKPTAINEFYRILKSGGRISIFEPIIKSNTKYYELINPFNFPDYDRLKEIEIEIMSDENDPLTNFDDQSLYENFKSAGFQNIDIDINTEESTYQASASMVDPWFTTPPRPGDLTIREKYLKYLSEPEVDKFIEDLKQELDGKMITVKSLSAYISAVK